MIDQKEYEKIIKETNIATRKGFDSTKIEWRKAALEIIYELCVAKEKITANEFTVKIKSMQIKTHDNRAIGGLIRLAQKFGWVAKTGEVEISKAGHLSRIQIWKSLICGKFKIENKLNFSFPKTDWYKSKRAFVDLGEGKFVVNGSAGKQYRTYIGLNGNNSCECEAYRYNVKKNCKHIEMIIKYFKKLELEKAAEKQTKLF